MKLKTFIKVIDLNDFEEVMIEAENDKVNYHNVILKDGALNSEIKDIYFYHRYDEDNKKHDCLVIEIKASCVECKQREAEDILRKDKMLEWLTTKRVEKYIIFNDSNKKHKIEEVFKNRVITTTGIVRPITDIKFIGTEREEYQAVWDY